MENNFVEEVMQLSTRKTHDELYEISKKLHEDGLDPACSDDLKICYLWRIYLHTQENLQVALRTVKELQEQQSEEMVELENYVTHIRTLASERQALTLEFEEENEQLKTKIAQMTEQLQNYGSDDTREMLVEQGLDDIVEATHSEQIAYLLVERARLLDELDENGGSGDTVHTPDGDLTASQLYEILKQERKDFESDLLEQRNNLVADKEKLKQENEEEMELMIVENEKLQDMLDAARKQVDQLTNEVGDLESQLDAKGSAKLAKDNIDGEKLRKLQTEIANLQAERKTLQDKVRGLTSDVERSQAEHISDLDQISKLSTKCHDQQRHHKTLEVQLDRVNAEKEILEDKLTRSDTKLKRLEATDQEGDVRVSADSAQLRRENRELLGEMDSVRGEMAAERIARREAEGRARRAEAEIKDLTEEKERLNDIMVSKVKSVESKLDEVDGERAKSDSELTRLRNDHKRELDSLIAAGQSETEELRSQIRDLNKLKRELEREVSNIRLEVGILQDKVMRGEEKQKRLTEEKTRLQQQIEELNKKVQSVSQERDARDKLLQQEQLRNKDVVSSMEVSLAEAQRNYERVKEDLQITKAEISRKEHAHGETKSELAKRKASVDESLASLRQELVTANHQHQEEVFEVTSKLDRVTDENDRLKTTLSDKEQELIKVNAKLEHFTNNAKSDRSQIERQLETEIEKRAEMEGRNKSLEEEATRTWSKLQELLEKVSRIEKENERLNAELEKVSVSCKAAEEKVMKREEELKEEHTKAENTAKKLSEAQSELEKKLSQLKSTEQQLQQLSPLKNEVAKKDKELTELRKKLNSHKTQISTLEQSMSDVKSQLSASRQREHDLNKANQDLQHLLEDVQAKIDNMKDQTSAAAEMRQLAENNKKSLVEQVTRLTADVESLQAQLMAAAEKYDVQWKRYAERKQRTKNKLLQARELYMDEKNKLRLENDKLEQELLLASTALSKEREWKEHLESSQRAMLVEKRQLLTQLSESEEVRGDQRRQLSTLQVKLTYLEEQNSTLQERTEELSRQKHSLDRLIQDYQDNLQLSAESSRQSIASPRSASTLNNGLTSPFISRRPLALEAAYEDH